ncbi:alpha/beta fold hydrolase [uncultured Ruminococcus sp.]|uniref:alpha/beta fold hydrolase n=1 Tax=uncultured Ruminococcus sp. TaxID=165186 RepID=UPI000ECBD08D|nr:alpha/beta hydrolase [uncultured Ruminococcus sp.]HCJ40373.1 alpha/beta hydrolase [Ruminococcus sp.]
MFYELEEKTVEADGMSIDYAAFGTGKKVMVIVPGLTFRRVRGAGFTLARMYRYFADDFRIYVFDRRKNIPEGYSAEDIADEIYSAMKALSLEKACVMGVSQGGMAVQYLALKHPEMVEKLVLGVTLSRPNPTIREAVAEWTELIEKGDLEQLVISSMRRGYPPEKFNKFRLIMPAVAKAGKPKDPTEFLRMAKACLTCDTYDRLTEIKCPTLVIGDRQDNIAAGEASLEIAEKMGCELVMYDGLGHSVYEEKCFNDEVRRFFTEQSEN